MFVLREFIIRELVIVLSFPETEDSVHCAEVLGGSRCNVM